MIDWLDFVPRYYNTLLQVLYHQQSCALWSTSFTSWCLRLEIRIIVLTVSYYHILCTSSSTEFLVAKVNTALIDLWFFHLRFIYNLGDKSICVIPISWSTYIRVNLFVNLLKRCLPEILCSLFEGIGQLWICDCLKCGNSSF